MKKYILKRDGRRKQFNKDKIIAAISNAFIEVDGDISDYAIGKANNIADYIETIVNNSDKMLSVEDIQDLVEKGLMSTKRKDVAKKYLLYRETRNIIRNQNQTLTKIISKKINASDVQNQNANVDEKSFGGKKGEAIDAYLKDYALNYIVSPLAKNNHLNNEIYIHDLGDYAVGSHNCLSLPIDDLLANGFNTRQTDVRPANSINTAFQLLAVLFQLQSLQQFGGVSATHLDWSMVPYVRKSFRKHFKDGIFYIENLSQDKEISDRVIDTWGNATDMSIESPSYKTSQKAYKYAMDMTERELKQAVEGMFHNLNTLQSRSGNQLPFTSINFGTCTSIEGRMVIEALLNGGIKGVGKLHKTSIFPCTIFQYMKGVNDKPGTPNYDLYRLALKSTAKRLYPNYMLCNWSVDASGDVLDKELKQKYLDSLTEEQMNELVQWCEDNSELANLLGIEVVDE